MMKKIFTNIFFLFVYANLTFAQIEYKHELRSTWVASVSNIDWPKNGDRNDPDAQKAELIRMLDLYKSININAIFLQVRPECDALYNSAYEPWSRYLTYAQGTNPGYDPLQFAIEEAHKRGIELHAWLNPYRINATTSDGGDYYHSTHIYREHPEWAIEYSNGKKILNPGRPEVMSYIADVVEDIVSNYNVDGIHFDDYFYSYDGTSSSLDADEYAAYGGGMSLSDWRRDNINRMIDSVYTTIQNVKPTVRFGVSPFGIYKNGVPSGIVGLDAYSTIYCDPLAWLEDGTVDYLTPQLYWPTGGGQDFETLANWWSDQVHAHGRHLYTGHGTYRFDNNPNPIAPNSAAQAVSELHEHKSYFDKTPDNNVSGESQNLSALETYSTSDPVAEWTLSQIGLQIDIVRLNNSKNALGSVFFSAKDFDRVSGLADYMVENKYTHPAIIPEMTWKTGTSPVTPTNLREETIDTEVYLIWDHTKNSENDRYAVYSSEILTDANDIIIDPDNLKEIRFDNKIPIADLNFSSATTIAITAISAYGEESLPASYSVSDNRPVIITQLPAEGTVVAKTQDLSWTSDTPGVTYQIQIADNELFSNPIISSAWMGVNEVNIEPIDLDGEKTFYWRVRAQSDVVGPYSISSFTTGYPQTPELTAPANLSQKISTFPKIKWEASTAADSMKVQISKFISFSSIEVEENFLANPGEGTLTTELEKNTTYYLRISAFNELGNSPYSATNSFKTTDGVIPDVIIIGPNDEEIVASTDIFEWETTTAEGTITYYLEVATDENFSTIVANSGWISETSVPLNEFELGGQTTFFWHVKAKSEYGESEFTPVRSITTGYPVKPLITSPTQLSEDVSVYTPISWMVAENVDSIYAEFSETSDYSTVVASETFAVSNDNASLTNPLKGYTWYYLRISAANEYGHSSYSPNRYFKTGIGSSLRTTGIEHISYTVYPNPYVENLSVIEFISHQPTNIKIDIINSLGKYISTICENEVLEQGKYQYRIDENGVLSPGIYFVRIQAHNKTDFIKIIVTD